MRDASAKLGGAVVITGTTMTLAYTAMVVGKHYIEVTCTLSNGLSAIVYFVLTLTDCSDAKITSFYADNMDYSVYGKTMK